jgi:hypothetical protein
MRTFVLLILILSLPAFAADPDNEARLARLQEMMQDLGFEQGDAALRWALSGEHEGPFHMVNLLKFRKQAQYPDGAYPGSTGVDAQRRYGEMMRKLTESVGVRSLMRNPVVATAALLGGEDEQWDMVTVVYYPSPQALIRMIEDPRYRAAAVHKHAALERTRAIITLPGGPVTDLAGD